MTEGAGVSIFGRDGELSTLAAFLDATSDLPGGVILQGEAGAGKTTLYDATLALARDRSYRVLEARPTAAEARLSFAALRDLLDRTFDEVVDDLPPPQRQALGVALLRADPGSVPERAGAVEAGFVGCLARLAADAPVLLAIEDVQWLDRPSRRVLEYAVRRLTAMPVALLVSSRIDDDAEGPLGLRRAFDERRLRAIPVGSLSLGAFHALLLHHLGTPFPRPVLRRIHEVSRGNPLFALELGRALLRRGRGLEPGEALPVPDDIRQLVRSRLHALPRPTRDLLLVAAAMGDPDVRTVDAASHGDPEPAVHAGIISMDAGRIRFVHPLFASGIYADARPAERRDVHRRLAPLMHELEARARHLALASLGPDEAVADVLERSARGAHDRGAIDAAVELVSRACDATPPDRADALHRRRIAEAEYCLRAGDSARAFEVVEAAVADALPGRQRAEALFYRARLHMWGVDWGTTAALLRDALKEAAGTPDLLARIELGLAQMLNVAREDVGETARHARRTARLATQIGRDDILAEALGVQAKNEVLRGSGLPAELLERSLSLQPAMRHLWVIQWPIDYLAVILEWMDDLMGATSAFEEVIRLAHERGDEASIEWTLWRLAHVEVLTGAWSSAEEHLADGYIMAVQGGRTEVQALYLAVSSLLAAHRGDVEAARAAGQHTLELATRSSAAVARREAQWALGLLALSAGEPAEADAYLSPLFTEARAAGIGEPGALRFVGDEIEALIELGRFAEAEQLLDWLEERGRRLDRPSAGAVAGRGRGLLLAARGDLEGALKVLRRALAAHDRVPMPFERARTLVALGRVARRAKSRRAARDACDQAIATFDDLGAAMWAARARAELARIGGRRPADGRLTATEQRVAELLAEGRTSEDVAAELFVTSKTVETYVSRIYAKLGVHSRAALSHRLSQADLAAPPKV